MEKLSKNYKTKCTEPDLVVVRLNNFWVQTQQFYETISALA